jgi:hypothetical protein
MSFMLFYWYISWSLLYTLQNFAKLALTISVGIVGQPDNIVRGSNDLIRKHTGIKGHYNLGFASSQLTEN